MKPLPKPATLSPEKNPQHDRRGVLLLVVLSLLVLFALISVTFVLIAGQYRRSSRSAARAEQYGDDPRKQLDEVFAQIVRDTINTNSSLQSHSLLNDMYGNDGVQGIINGTNNPTYVPAGATATQFIDITVTPGTGLTVPTAMSTQVQSAGFFNGCVLTMTSGPAANLSTRIVGYSPAGNFTFRVLAFNWSSTQVAIDFFNNNNASNPQAFIINGRPFNGTGFGYNNLAPVTPLNTTTSFLNLNGTVTDSTGATLNIPYAFLPNGKYLASAGGYGNIVATGGADEDYDAPDPQNMLLAYMPVNPTVSSQILPSLHRQDLINYMQTKYPTGGPALMRQVSMRPLPADHPNFTGSNPSYNATGGPWDVDNDGDGIADSVWVDVGIPVQTAPDGRRFKPLAAILCLDMDGRLNVNAHGSIAQIEAQYTQTASGTTFPYARNGVATPIIRGQGYGPADISLAPLFGASPTQYSQLLGGNASSPGGNPIYAGRYGELNRSQYIPTSGIYPIYGVAPAGAAAPPYPGTTGVANPLNMIKQFEFPFYASPAVTIPTSYSTAADVWGRTYVGTDVRGMPMISYPNDVIQTYNDPYEINLNQQGKRAAGSPTASGTYPADEPFAPGELERILRQYDIDASALPDRLRVLLGVGSTTPLRNMVTTDSFDLPVPNSLVTPELRAVMGGPGIPVVAQDIVSMLKARLGGLTSTPPPIYSLLTPEIIAGQRMDLNRPFGNGRDDSPYNGVVDEPSEATTEQIWFPPAGPIAPTTPASMSQFSGLLFDHDNDGLTGAAGGATERNARYLVAKNLYVLMMLLKGNGEIDFDGDPTNNTAAETARGIAQWAVNVVDFRDRDSIMTPFKYDANPFADGDGDGNPWDVSSDVSVTADLAYGGIVWGCERPELLITETLAFHDRRTEDLATESVDTITPTYGTPSPTDMSAAKTTGMSPNKDRDFDQRLRPRGSLFIELYNPWTTQTSNTNAAGYPSAVEASGEFYTLNTGTNTATGVNLNQATPGGSPVWRLLIVDGNALQNLKNFPRSLEPKDPDDPDVTQQPTAVQIERSIYFVSPGAAITDNHGQSYFASAALSSTIAPLLPGRYAVVGSAGQPGLNTATQYINTIGRLQSTSAGAANQDGVSTNVRQIVLAPNANPNTPGQVQVLNNFRSVPEPTAPTQMQYPIAAVIDQTLIAGVPTPASLSISEPVAGYPTGPGTGWVAAAGGAGVPGAEGQYSPPLDYPLDMKPELLKNGTTPRYKFIHLQRLADPTIDWNATTNPYRTIDTRPVALTSFNGVTNDLDPNGGNLASTQGITTFQRGDRDPSTYFNTLWWREAPTTLIPPLLPGGNGGPTHNYDYSLRHTLGFINSNYGDYSSASGAPTVILPTDTIAGAPASPAYVGAPKPMQRLPSDVFPFASLIWNNRPFTSATELMLVPKTRSSQLLLEYTMGQPGSYYVAPPSNAVLRPPGGHLLNFFEVTGDGGSNSPTAFYRLLEYVHVPSPFIGTETEINPTSTTGMAPAELAKEKQLLSQFHPPFNKVSNYREPGRVNINTMPAFDFSGSDSPTWQGIARTTNLLQTPQFALISQSRRGYTPTTPGTELGANNAWPSFFSNPFRSFGGAQLTLPPLAGQTPRKEAEVTMMRSSDPTSTNPAAPPLFASGLAASGAPYPTAEDPTRNAAVLYENFTRLNNLLTTRSNVYAVWITVGYFEVTSVGLPTTVYPDGYQLGQELGSDSGEITRHRAFYMYDRTIPVGFEPGKDHNFDKGILVKRYIE